MIDLDALERCGVALTPADDIHLQDAIAELRASRKVIEAARFYQRKMRGVGRPGPDTNYQVMEAWAALDAALAELEALK